MKYETPMEDTETSEKLICNSCGYKDYLLCFEPVWSIYSGRRCPECGSLNNDHNNRLRDETKELFRRRN
jgi:hypothetical protein